MEDYIGWCVFSRKLVCDDLDRIKYVKSWNSHENRFTIADMDGKHVEFWTPGEVKERVILANNLVRILRKSDNKAQTFAAIMRRMLYDTLPEFTLNFPTYYKNIGINPPDDWMDSDKMGKMWSYFGDEKDSENKLERASDFLEMVRHGLDW